MNKRHQLLVWSLLVGFILVGCKFQDDESNFQEMEQGENFEVIEDLYQIERVSYVKDYILIDYPQIRSFSDQDIQNKANAILKADALSVIATYGDTENLHLNMDYYIALEGKKLLSVNAIGTGYVQGAAHPNNHFVSTNINLKTGGRVHLNEVFIIDKAFLDKFYDRTFIAVNPEHNDQVVQKIVTENLSRKLEEADYRKPDSTEIECYSYFNEDYLGLVFLVPHALGDYVQYQAQYNSLISNIIYENEIWQDL
ncbi:MAG: hypothetical protein PHD88_06435 [Firmicutes bacterium]|nr:hypothetical protein [Bacillota bacterium]MDD4263910.1 hypothetical protein [Bacillota bacterium]MDD4694016.1 hypothetical protein [Bacillota bacterium]